MKTVKNRWLAVAGIALLAAAPPCAAARTAASQPTPAPAPAAASAPAASAAAPAPWTLKNTFGKWGVLCNPANPAECRAAQTQNYADTGNQGRLLQVLLAVDKGRTFAVMTLPFGVDLRAGIAVKIDEGAEVKGIYSTCLPDGCQSVLELEDRLIEQVRSGMTMKVGFRPWGGEEKTFVVDVPLDGARSALAAISR